MSLHDALRHEATTYDRQSKMCETAAARLRVEGDSAQAVLLEERAHVYLAVALRLRQLLVSGGKP